MPFNCGNELRKSQSRSVLMLEHAKALNAAQVGVFIEADQQAQGLQEDRPDETAI